MFQSYAITLCRVFITQQKISTSLSVKSYLCDYVLFYTACATGSLFGFMCLRVCRVCVFLLYFVFLMLFKQLPSLKFHNKVFATNWSQILVFFEDLIKYILSLKNCNTIWNKKKGNKNYKKKNKKKRRKNKTHKVSLCNVHVMSKCFLLFLSGLRRG